MSCGLTPVRLVIERDLAVVIDRQKINSAFNFRVQHKVMVYDVFTQIRWVYEQRLQSGFQCGQRVRDCQMQTQVRRHHG